MCVLRALCLSLLQRFDLLDTRFCGVLVRVRRLIFENLDKLVKSARYDCPENWTDPVNPVVGLEISNDDRRAERTRGIEGAAGEVYTYLI